MSTKPHSFDGQLGGKKRCHAHYCTRCGLIMLKNEASQKAARKPCPGREDD